MKDKQTPLMRQYTQMKTKYPDTVLLFRLGDFFETFNDDAVIASKVCGLTLTKRNNGASGDMPLAGFPHHQLDTYLPKLVRAGYRVAVCEQLEDPKKARGIVKRDVIEVVTPGVALNEKLLETKRNNYAASVVFHTERGVMLAGLACADISTGEFFVSEVPAAQIVEVLENLVPAEIIISKSQKNYAGDEISKLSYKPAITKLEEWIFDVQFGREALLGHFKTQNLKGFGIENMTVGLAAAGAMLNYINETQKSQLQQIKRISAFNPSEFMTLDSATRRNLEIAFSMSETSQDGTLISILDKTQTPMGGRLFKKWLTRPLRKLDTIKRRLEVVRAFHDSGEKRAEIREILSGIGDMERLISRICSAKANPRDVIALKNSLRKIPSVKDVMTSFNIPSLQKLSDGLKPLTEIADLIETALIEEPSVQLGTGKVFHKGYSEELDSYVEASTSGKNWISDYQEEERKRSGIPSLKVGYTSVFGYYIEITRTHQNKVPESYERKQTLANAERYTTKELKDIESKILNAEEKIGETEQGLFTELLMKIALQTESIQDDAARIAALDCLQSFAQASAEYNYTEPQIDDSEILEIIDGRHPVVERLLPIGEKFTPNSTNLDTDGEQIHIITGPNMSGKSCYLRQTALVVLLGQVGCFVPAKSARFGIVDRIFTRVGAQDNITAGESTFLVEMQEAANILNNATSKSLILLDEVGRGTATFDGISIAWAIAEYIHNSIGAKTLFATHYHELNDLAARYEHIANYQVEVIETGGTVIFSHHVKPGASDHSFGIHVAQMAGLPDDVIDRANIIMKSLEGSAQNNGQTNEISAVTPDISAIDTSVPNRQAEQLAIFEVRDDSIREKIETLDINNLTPIQALQILSDLHKEVRKGKKK